MKRKRFDLLPIALLASVASAFIAAYFTFRAWQSASPPTTVDAVFGPPEIRLAQARFAEIPGWSDDNQAEAIPPLLLSCARLERLGADASANPIEALGAGGAGATLSGKVGDWLPACEAAKSLMTRAFPDAAAAASQTRAYFEAYFRPVRITAIRQPRQDGPAPEADPEITASGKFTGYYEPTYDASPIRTERLIAPALMRPSDLVTVDLGAFRPTLAGQRIAGRVENGALAPYPDRKAIEAGALGTAAIPLAWLAPDDLFFLQIQGSGRLAMPGGAEMRIGYDGQNGWPYVPIGRILIERGEADKATMSMQTIRRWLATARPEAAAALRHENPAYVFFRRLHNLPNAALGPLGAEGVQLTPLRSLAVDRRFYAMGSPVWVVLKGPDGLPSLRRLMIAQDTGGAITGPIRGDIFFGSGFVAGDEAGRLNAEGEMFVLLPAPLAAELPPPPAPPS